MDARVAKSEVRQRLAVLVGERPGITITDLGKLVGLSHSTVSYHLRILEQAGEIQSKRDGRTVRYYTHGQYEDLRVRLAPLLQRKRVVAIIKLIEERPDLRPFNIARELEVSVPTVMWHLAKLRDYGALQMEKRNGQYDIILNPELKGIV
ncbi:MAG TPA: winged helix-turn-helix transcriptional regulator [Candidatus Thermoplasmatota archaeon]|jgi:predicted transcriptional regulator|nr:winged helix-turn-helix transcriptional regulator [Candidatus Thermoplasmatota archaeon]